MSPSKDVHAIADEELARFYERAYTPEDPERAALYGRWRALGAAGKADHVVELCTRAGLAPASTIEIGCGDGALLCELHGRGFGGRLAGVEIAPAAVEIARSRPEIEAVDLYDGIRLAGSDGSYDLGILSHVLEHVREPAALLAEAGRVCGAVVVEVPLEANVSARRASKREHAAEVGHLQRLDRADARAIVAQAGMSIAGELEDPLGRSTATFFASSPSARARASAKWAFRSGLHQLWPTVGRRLFTVHYACLCVTSTSPGRRSVAG
jgi:SAM-dependent methyltransferase